MKLTTGKCGDNIFYEFNSKTGELFLSGSGEMYNYGNQEPELSDFCLRNEIKHLIISGDITKIGGYAFGAVYSLESVSFPLSLREIACGAFCNCTSLKHLELPEGVRKIGDEAFSGCASLKSVNIPEGIESVEHSVFQGCASLECIELPQTVKSIEGYAFAGCKKLAEVNIPKGVADIKNHCFFGCKSLKSPIYIPEGVEHLGDCAFNGCEALEDIYLPDSLASIGSWAFENSVKNIYYSGSHEQWKRIKKFYGRQAYLHIAIHFGKTDSPEADTDTEDWFVEENGRGHYEEF